MAHIIGGNSATRRRGNICMHSQYDQSAKNTTWSSRYWSKRWCC